MNTLRHSIRCVLAAALCASAGVAAAEDAATSGPVALEEVIVTAQKRTERLVDVPASITAVSSEDLTRENLVSVLDFYSRIPNLQYQCRQTYCLSLRGLSTGGATNPTLAILIDDVQFGSSLAAGLGNSRFPDIDPSMLERVEVLRGPQGTLYGASSLGGLIKYVTRQPQTDKFSARAEVGTASTKDGSTGWNTRGSVNLPFASEHAALSVSAFNREDPAYIDNIATGFVGKDVNKTHTYGGQAALLIKPFEGLSFTLTAMQQKRDADFDARIQVLPDPTGGPNGTPPPNYVPAFGENTIKLTSTSDFGKQELYTARIEWKIGEVNITSITAYGKSTGTNLQDLTAIFGFLKAPPFYGAGSVVDIADTGGTRKKSEELRVSGKAGPVDWRGGLFWTKETGSVDQTLTLMDSGGALLATPYIGSNPFEYKERAAFADVVWHMAPQFDLQAGVRYAKNDQSYGGDTIIDGPAQLAFGPSSTLPLGTSGDHSFTWAISPTYHLNPDLMLYFRAASGYRPGGPNTPIGTIPLTYKPDRVVNYELGLKGFAYDKKVGFEAALFQINWKDIQLQNTDAATQFTYTTNGGRARSRGLEASVDYRPVEGLTFAANATVLDAKLSEALPTFSGTDTLVGASGDRLPGSAKFSSNLSVQKDIHLTSSLDGYVGANWAYVGARRSAFVNSAVNASRFDEPSYSQVDLRAGLETASQWRVDLYARNVFDKHGVVWADNRNGTNTNSVLFLMPRTLGLTLSKSF
ncbi:MAG: TonB-dependent receptor [Proteobacteria bacterium]|nr:TonB-dependent receptor [Pseudomonadota bacterium]